jgi:hypothetical protein
MSVGFEVLYMPPVARNVLRNEIYGRAGRATSLVKAFIKTGKEGPDFGWGVIEVGRAETLLPKPGAR